MDNKVVLHRIYFHSLIQLAFEENLLNPDNYYYRNRIMNNSPVPKWIEDNLKQQLILTPNIITNDLHFYEGTLNGHILDKIHQSKHSKKEVPGEYLNKINYNIVSQILKLENKRTFDESQFKAYLVELIKVNEKIIEEQQQNNYPELMFNSLEADNILRTALGGQPFNFPDLFVEKIKLREKLWSNVADVWNCYNEIYNLIEIANDDNALLMIPLSSEHYPFDVEKFSRNANISYLFNITCKEIGTIPTPYNLKNAIKLSTSEEAVDLRVFLNNWIDSLVNENDLEIEKLKKEISTALKFLREREKFSQHSTISTFLGIPGTLLGFISFLMSIPGIMVTFYGAYTTLQDFRIKKKYNWAMFRSRIE